MNKNLLGPWVRRFLVGYVIAERHYSSNTQQSYRDMFRLLLPFAAKRHRCPMEQLTLDQISPQLVREFTDHLEKVRQCSLASINHRLTALRAWAGFVGTNCPEHLEWSRQIQTVHFKKHAPSLLNYLEKEEMQALLATPNQKEAQGFRDYTLLLFLYNTGARASEASHLTIGDLDLESPAATLRGKGSKTRQCPLWKVTANALRHLVAHREASQAVFLSERGGPLTRYGIHTLVERHAQRAAAQTPSLKTKRVSPHVIRHATAMALLRSGVDINTIRVWLGHVSLRTTHIYAQSDLKMKAEALACCEAPLLPSAKRRSAAKGLMGFLNTM
jgi:site-specific recombinase XerD